MKQYLDLVKYVLKNGTKKEDRTGVGTISCFGYQNRYDLREGFPIVTTKKINFEAVKAELLWFLEGSVNTKRLKEIYGGDLKIWDAWANGVGDLGPIYGCQWRSWEDYRNYNDGPRIIDQISELIDGIKKNPNGRRHIVSAWNPSDIQDMALPPCHCFFQLNVLDDFVDLQLYQRSADVALGVPFNISSYSLLLEMIAMECGLIPRYFIHTFGDVHIYLNHMEKLKEQIELPVRNLPKININRVGIFDIGMNDIYLDGYEHGNHVKFDIAV